MAIPAQHESREEELYPALRHPYYIVAPRYIGTSAGVKALHLLCHTLNRTGERAYLVVHPNWTLKDFTHPDLLTPVLTPEGEALDFSRGLTPITVYAETVAGNPFAAPFVVRYVLNFPGLLGGDRGYRSEEYLVAYSRALAESVGAGERVLFIPASDPLLFKPEPRVPRSGTCFYAGKYKYFHRAPLLPVTANSTEITRDMPGSQSPVQIAELFRRSELFYCYENSALAIEALLCECPVVFLPNAHFERAIGATEIGWDGIAWGADPAEVARAIATVRQGRDNYLRAYAAYWRALETLIEDTQRLAGEVRYARRMSIPYRRVPYLVHKWFSIRYGLPIVIANHGWAALFRIILRKLGFRLQGQPVP